MAQLVLSLPGMQEALDFIPSTACIPTPRKAVMVAPTCNSSTQENQEFKVKPGAVTHALRALSHSTWEAEVGGCLSSIPVCSTECIQDSQGYTEKSYLKESLSFSISRLASNSGYFYLSLPGTSSTGVRQEAKRNPNIHPSTCLFFLHRTLEYYTY